MAQPEEPKNVVIARALLTDQKPTFAWFETAFQLLTGEYFTKEKYEQLDLTLYWNEKFGFVRYIPSNIDLTKMSREKLITRPEEFSTYYIKWVRPDGGPTEPYFVMPIDADPFSFFMYIWLHAFIMLDLQINGLCSYVEVGGPPDNWKDLSVFFDGQESTACSSACALTGTCVVPDRNDQGNLVRDEHEDKVKTKIIRGHVIIASTKDKSFF